MFRKFGASMRSAGILLALVLLAAACAPASQGRGADPTIPGGTVTMRLVDPWGSLDPFYIAGPRRTVLAVNEALYDHLVARNAEGKLVGYLAESWTQTPTTITFTIRNGVTCSDGTPLTASAVGNWLKVFTDKSKANATRYLGNGPWGIASDDAKRTVTLTLAVPNADVIYSFSNSTMPVVCPQGVNNIAMLETGTSGTGPFVVESATADQLTLKVRPEWSWGPWGQNAKSSGFPEKVIYRVVTNDTTASNLLLTGGLDVAEIVSGAEIQRLLNEKSLMSKFNDSFYAYSMVMNQTPERITSDERIREALMTAVDPKEYTQVAYRGTAKAATSLFHSSWECYEKGVEALLPQPSTDKARQLLIAAGYTAGANGKLQKDGKPLTINLITRADEGAVEYIADRFDKSGITVKLDNLDQTGNSLRVRTGAYDVAVQRAGVPDQNPSVSIGLFSGALPPVGTNYSFVIDAPLNQLVAKATASAGAERCQAWKDVQKRLIEKHLILPLSHPRFYIFSKDIDMVYGNYPLPGSFKRLK